MLRCIECGCRSELGTGWIAVLARDPDEDEHAATTIYCPVCSTRELGLGRTDGYTWEFMSPRP
jgi:DNA-directed RNA polymerase subunit RPC12/RpoP